MYVIGLTGGIGSGKSTVADLFAKLNVPIIDADVIARSLVKPEHPIYQKIIEKFGDEILNANHELDRKKLSKIIFSDALAKDWLEKTLHPLIDETIKKELLLLKTDYVIVIIPLLFETGPHDYLDRILVVDCPESLQIARTKKRDQINEAHIKQIIDVQVKRENRIRQADDIIENNADISNLIKEVEKLHEKYLRLSRIN